MKISYVLTIFAVFVLCNSSFALGRAILTESYFEDNFELELQSGVLFSGYNDVQIPGTVDGTRFSLSDDLEPDNEIFFRLSLQYSIDERHHFTMLYTPNKIDAGGILKKDVIFDGVTFLTDTKIDAQYVFNTLRLQYRWDFVLTDTVEFGMGLTFFIRDAEISLQNADDTDNKASYDNVGYVGLLNFRLLVKFSETFSMLMTGDLFADSVGRAEDVFMGVMYQATEEFAFQLGYRVIEGGADKNKIYTFTLINYLAVGLVYNF